MPDLARTLADIDAAVQAWEQIDAARWTPALLDDDGRPDAAGWTTGLNIASGQIGGVDVTGFVVTGPAYYPTPARGRHVAVTTPSPAGETAFERCQRLIGEEHLDVRLPDSPLTTWQRQLIDSLPDGNLQVVFDDVPPVVVARYDATVQMSQEMSDDLEAFTRILIEARAAYRRKVKRLRMRYLHTMYRARRRGWR